MRWCIIRRTMKSKLLVIAGCLMLAACAPLDDVKETGITRDRAVSIAKAHCPEYPDRFGFVDRVQWVPEKGYWAVLLDDRSQDHGRVYHINREGQVVGTRDINRDRGDFDEGPRG